MRYKNKKKFKATLIPNWCVLDLLVWIKTKQPSPVTKPDIQWLISELLGFAHPHPVGLVTLVEPGLDKDKLGISGLTTGLIYGKAIFNLSLSRS